MMQGGRENSFKDALAGLPWGSSGSDSVLPLQGVRVQSLVRKIRFPSLSLLQSSGCSISGDHLRSHRKYTSRLLVLGLPW